jgi:gliding motility-associated-like protein
MIELNDSFSAMKKTIQISVGQIFVLILLTSTVGRASHIVGGNLELQLISPISSTYRLSLVMFFDKKNARSNSMNTEITAAIFRKRDNQRMMLVPMPLQENRAVVYANSSCATQQGLETSFLSYDAIVNLPPNLYNDPNGYYVVWERCCRNNVINNILSPGQTGNTFYMEFPPTTITNSSPSFRLFDGEYICRDTDYEVMFDASDADGDQLRYALVDPYRGTSTNINSNPIPVGLSSYPTINWASGFSASQAIKGSPPLQIEANTGRLSVRATELGLFVFTVEVREFRNGQQIGLTRRDFQILVIDCASIPPPKPNIFTPETPEAERDVTINDLDICGSGFVILSTRNSPDLSYQWQKEGQNIPDATTASLIVKFDGKYGVVISSNRQCGTTSASEKVNVTLKEGEDLKLVPTNPSFCEDQKPTLKIENLQTSRYQYRFQWLLEGDTLRNRTAPELLAERTGMYSVRIKNLTTACNYEFSVPAQLNFLPVVQLINRTNKKVVCEKDSIVLKAVSTNNTLYQWRKDGQPLSILADTLVVTTSGIYSFRATNNSTGCQKDSDTLHLRVNPLPVGIALDSIMAYCDNRTTPTNLVGQPTGGVFGGTGVRGNLFDPVLSGFGRFKISYEVTNQYKCSQKVFRWAVVSDPPKVVVPEEVNFWRGSNYQFFTDRRSDKSIPWTFEWTPGIGLSSTNQHNPLAQPDNSITYQLRVTDPDGCVTRKSIPFKVTQGLFAPNIFSPNGDGVNDVWEIKGLELYPQAEVTIFNRWGVAVFFSRGTERRFDGTLNGQPLPAGGYIYKIVSEASEKPLQGTLILAR